MTIQQETVWQPSAAAMRASRTCALFATLVAGWLAGRALLDRSAFPLVEVGLVLSSLLLFARVHRTERWDTVVRASAWALLAACAIGLVARMWGGTAPLGGELGSIAAISLLAIGWALITPFRWLKWGLTPFETRRLGRRDHERSTSGSDPIVERLLRERLRDERQFNARVLEVVPSVVYVRDLRDRSHVFVNRRVAEVIGYT